MPTIRPVKVHERETVEIQWTCDDGTVFYQRVTIPPKATRAAVEASGNEGCANHAAPPPVP